MSRVAILLVNIAKLGRLLNISKLRHNLCGELIFLILLLPSIIQSTEYSLSQIQQKLVGTGPHKLSPYIIKGSEKITLNNAPLSSEYYSIDYENGVIHFNIPLNPQDTILCTYKRLPLNLPKEYYHRKLIQKTKDENQEIRDDSTLTTHNPQPTTHDSQLSLMGTKTFGISIGSRQSLSFDQSMQISMNGNLSKGMHIEGTLKDDGTPLQPDGTTQQLKEIDKMFVNVRTEKQQLTLGDFEFNSAQSQFGKLERKLEGILGKSSIQYPASSIQLGGALSKGKWTRKEFYGTAGKQGPYELSTQGIIVAGSERIWVNGQLKIRGIDFTIDYSAATITFTALSPIAQDDRIVAEFQQKDESYRRTTIIGAHNSDNFNALVFKEEDMKNHPIAFTLTPERIDSLSKADSAFAWISGATYVGDKKGSYIKRDSIYEYVGYSKGDYELSFTRVQAGDYEFNPIVGGYEYVGNGIGNYIPKIRVPLPQSDLLLDVGYEKQINKIKFGIEGGATKFKSNLFAQSEQIGKAVAGRVETNHCKWTLGANFRHLDSNFQFPGTPDTLEPKREEVFFGLTPISLISTDTRIVRTPEDLKRSIGLKITPQKLPNLSYRYMLTKMKTINEFGTTYQIGHFEPFVRYEITNYRVWANSSSPEQSNITEIGAKSQWLNLSSKEVQQNSRLADRTSTIAIYTSPLSLTYTYKQVFDNTHPSAIDLGNLKFNAKGVDLSYELTSLERKIYEEQYYRVAPGNGSFSRDSITGKYYPDQHGDYEKMLIPSDKSAIYKNFKFYHGATLPLNQEVYIKLGALKQGEGDKIYLWKRTQFAVDDKNRISVATKVFDIYANYAKEDYRTNRITGIMNSGDQNILEINFRPQPYEITYITRLSREFTLLNLTWQERANTIGTGIQHPVSSSQPAVTCHFLLKGEERQIDEPPYQPTQLYGLSGEPTITYQLGNRGGEHLWAPKIITVRGKVTHWRTKTDVPPNVRVIYPPGISLNWGIDFTVLAKYNYTISYQGIKTPIYPVEHTLNAEIHINF